MEVIGNDVKDEIMKREITKVPPIMCGLFFIQIPVCKEKYISDDGKMLMSVCFDLVKQ